MGEKIDFIKYLEKAKNKTLEKEVEELFKNQKETLLNAFSYLLYNPNEIKLPHDKYIECEEQGIQYREKLLEIFEKHQQIWEKNFKEGSLIPENIVEAMALIYACSEMGNILLQLQFFCNGIVKRMDQCLEKSIKEAIKQR